MHDAVRLQEQHHHHPRLLGFINRRILLPVDGMDSLKIQIRGQIQQEEQQVVFQRPLHE